MSKYFYPNPNYVFFKEDNIYHLFNLRTPSKVIICNPEQSNILNELLNNGAAISDVNSNDLDEFFLNVKEYNLGVFLEKRYAYEPRCGFNYNHHIISKLKVSSIHIYLSSYSEDQLESILSKVNIYADYILVYFIGDPEYSEVSQNLILNLSSKCKQLLLIGNNFNTAKSNVIQLTYQEIKASLYEFQNLQYLPISESKNNPFHVNSKLYGNIFLTESGFVGDCIYSSSNVLSYMLEDKFSFWNK